MTHVDASVVQHFRVACACVSRGLWATVPQHVAGNAAAAVDDATADVVLVACDLMVMHAALMVDERLVGAADAAATAATADAAAPAASAASATTTTPVSAAASAASAATAAGASAAAALCDRASGALLQIMRTRTADDSRCTHV
jgi:hypothetical protein